MSETMNLHQAPETMILHRAPWAGRIMSVIVVLALVADGTIPAFRAGRGAVSGNRVRDGPDPCRGSDHTRLRHPLRHPGHRRPSAPMLVTGSWEAPHVAHARIGELGSPPELIPLLLGAMTWGGFYAPYTGHSAAHARGNTVSLDAEETDVQ